jgi:hypothetical protein
VITIKRDEIVTEPVNYAIYPRALGATAGDSAIPTFGKRMFDIHDRPYEFDFVMFEVEVVDFASIPNTDGGAADFDDTSVSGLPVIRYDGLTVGTSTATLKATINP